MKKVLIILFFGCCASAQTNLHAQNKWHPEDKGTYFEDAFYPGITYAVWREKGLHRKFADILVAPNPAVDKLEVWIPVNMVAANIQIQDVDGDILRQMKATGLKMEVAVQSLQPGSYRLVVLNEERYCSGEFIKQ